ncbi:MAG: hypothetical protein RJA99_1935 [Pseudomonadota bacterium]|jgi:uncharacterized membrane protein YjgN (DUF898 family)
MTIVSAVGPASLAEAPPAPPLAPPPSPAAAPTSGIEVYPVRFTGTGGGYFRVWCVNLLLQVLTLGFYTPWARRRTARWFLDHTEVAGSPLEFAAPMGRMVFGFLVFAGCFLAYEIARHSGQDAAALAMFVAAVVLGPVVWRGAMRFRLSSTRWRGLSLRFSTSWPEVYRASWPIAAIAALLAGAYLGLDATMPGEGAPHEAVSARLEELAVPIAALALGLLFGCGALLARLGYEYNRLLFAHGGLGDVPGRFKPGFGAFLKPTMIALSIFVLVVGAAIGLVAWVAMHPGETASVMKRIVPHGPNGRKAAIAAFVILVLLVVPLTTWVAAAPALAWREARVFSVVWNGVGLARLVRTQCSLAPWRFVRMRCVNVLLTVATLGLWRPFARVREYRMKVESVRLHVRGGLDALTGRLQSPTGGVADVLADVAGFDMIG